MRWLYFATNTVPRPPAISPRAIRERLKGYQDLPFQVALCDRLPDIQRDLALASDHNISLENFAKVEEYAVGAFDSNEFERQMEILGFDHQQDSLVISQFGSANRKWRIEPKGELDSSFHINVTAGLGFVTGVSKPIPPGWKPEWHQWDDATRSCISQTFGASVDHILEHRFLFTEGDGGLSIEEQIQIVAAANLPTPTLIVFTGGKSLHFYWRLSTPISSDRFRTVQNGIMLALKSRKDFDVDTSLDNPNRIMRAVGSIHPNTGRRCVIHTLNAHLTYTVEQIEAVVPAPAPRTIQAGEPVEAASWDAADALKLLEHIPNNVTDDRLRDLGLISYDFWLGVGMTLHWAGCDLANWISWSENSPRHCDGACETKWGSFDSDGGKTNSYLRWLARELSGFELKFVPATLTSPWILRGREKSKKIGEEIKATKEIEAARIAALPEWERDWDWKLQDSITLEQHVKNALMRKAKVEKSPVVFIQNRFRRYDPLAGYYRHVDIPNIRREIALMLEKVWRPTSKGERLNVFTTDRNLRACEKWLASTLYRNDNSFRASSKAIAFNNGTIYLRDGRWEFGDHSASNYLTHRIDAKVELGAECPIELKEFVRTSYGLQWLEIIRALIAYTVDPRYGCRIILFLLGKTGSGKGTLLALLQALVPAESRETVSRFDELNSHEAVAQKVMGKMMVTFPDVQGKQTGVSTLYRMLDAESRLSGRALHTTETVNFEFNGRVMAASTSTIQLDHAGSGLIRRMLTLETLDVTLKSDLLPQDRSNSGLLEKLLISKLGQIVGWALAMPVEEVEKVLQKRDDAGLLKTAMMKVAANADSSNIFIDSCLVPAPADHQPDLSEMYCCYRLLCIHQGMRPLASKNFKQRMSESLRHLFLPRRTAPGSGGAKKLPATFFGFKMCDKLWTSQVCGFTPASERHMVTNPGNSQSLGSMDTRQLIEGSFEDLSEHRPSR